MTQIPARNNSRWLVVALLTLGVIIAYTDRINLSAALPAVRASFPLTAEASGILLSAFFWAYTLLQTPAGWVVDRFGLKWPYAAGMFLWSAASAAAAMVSSLHGLFALRMVLGIGEAIVIPASMRYIRENFAERERGLPMGILMSGTKYGPAIGAPIATYLVLGFGWRWMFVLNGAFCIFWLVPWLFLVRDDDKTATVTKRTRDRHQSFLGRYLWYASHLGHLPCDLLLYVLCLFLYDVDANVFQRAFWPFLGRFELVHVHVVCRNGDDCHPRWVGRRSAHRSRP